MENVGERMAEAIKRWPSGSYAVLGGRARQTTRSLSRILAGEGELLVQGFAAGTGASRQMLDRYTSGNEPAQPSPQLLKAIAAVTGVRAEWLIDGRGPMTEPERMVSGSAGGAEAWWQEREEALIEGFPELRLTRSAWYSLFSLLMLYNTSGHPGGHPFFTTGELRSEQPDKESHLRAAREVGEMVGAAAARSGIDLSSVSRWQLEAYVTHSVAALSALLVRSYHVADEIKWKGFTPTSENDQNTHPTADAPEGARQ